MAEAQRDTEWTYVGVLFVPLMMGCVWFTPIGCLLFFAFPYLLLATWAGAIAASIGGAVGIFRLKRGQTRLASALTVPINLAIVYIPFYPGSPFSSFGG